MGTGKNVKDTEDDVVYMIKKQKARRKKNFHADIWQPELRILIIRIMLNLWISTKNSGLNLNGRSIMVHIIGNIVNRHVKKKKFLDWLNINDTFKRDME